MGYTKPKQKMNLFKRSCVEYKCDLFLDRKGTYVVKDPEGFFEKIMYNFKENTKILCITCDRDIKIKSLIK